MEVVIPGFGVVIVTTIAEWVDGTEGGGHGTGGGDEGAPAVVGIVYNCVAAAVVEGNDIALEIIQIVIICAVVVNCARHTVGGVHEFEGVGAVGLLHEQAGCIGVFCCYAVDGFGSSQSVRSVFIGNGVAVAGGCCQLAAFLPSKGIAVVSQRVADGIVSDGLPIIGHQLVFPCGIVGVGDGVLQGAEGGRGGVGVIFLCANIPAIIVGVNDGLIRVGVVFAG